MTFEEWVDENIKYIRTPDIFQWLSEAWDAGAKVEREACAKVCDESGLCAITKAVGTSFAAAIRARSKTK